MENKFKEDHEFWARVEQDCKEAVRKAEAELVVNLVFLEAAQKELKRFPKPKKEAGITG